LLSFGIGEGGGLVLSFVGGGLLLLPSPPLLLLLPPPLLRFANTVPVTKDSVDIEDNIVNTRNRKIIELS
jgi:hypothetical protein